MSSKPDLALVVQAQDFFREQLTAAFNTRNVSVQPETEFYLVNLLHEFMATDRLYRRSPDGQMQSETLALMLKEALEQAEPQAQNLMFRHIGDVSLYVAGYFQDSLSRKLVDVDYYIDVGGTAYRQVALRAQEEIRKGIYSELSDKFASFVEVFATVSENLSPKTEKDLLRLYDLWVTTRSDRAAKALQQAGILPNETIKKDWQ